MHPNWFKCILAFILFFCSPANADSYSAQFAREAEVRFFIAARTGVRIDACVESSTAARFWLQDFNEERYAIWQRITEACGRGVPLAELQDSFLKYLREKNSQKDLDLEPTSRTTQFYTECTPDGCYNPKN